MTMVALPDMRYANILASRELQIFCQTNRKSSLCPLTLETVEAIAQEAGQWESPAWGRGNPPSPPLNLLDITAFKKIYFNYLGHK